MKTLLTIEDLQIKYDNTIILENVNFEIKEKSFITIIGPNGGGKTTLIKAIIGFIDPTQGTITTSKNLKIGYVPQKNSFEEEFPINVKTVILSGILNKHIKLFHSYSKSNKETLNNILKKLNIEKLKYKQINELSGGELQKVLLARAIISNPNLLILDEPFSNIDVSSTKEYYKILENLSETMSVLMISHDIGVIASYTDDVICVNKTVHYHHGSKLSNNDIQNTYGCPVELIGHGIPHRIFPNHSEGENND
jgi:zinc transport system ATP-binding protein